MLPSGGSIDKSWYSWYSIFACGRDDCTALQGGFLKDTSEERFAGLITVLERRLKFAAATIPIRDIGRIAAGAYWIATSDIYRVVVRMPLRQPEPDVRIYDETIAVRVWITDRHDNLVMQFPVLSKGKADPTLFLGEVIRAYCIATHQITCPDCRSRVSIKRLPFGHEYRCAGYPGHRHRTRRWPIDCGVKEEIAKMGPPQPLPLPNDGFPQAC